MKKRILALITAFVMVVTMLPASAFAQTEENDNSAVITSNTIDFAEFIKNVENANYNYDGNGITVKWSPSSACTNNLVNHDCLFKDEQPAPEADGNNPQRGQNANAQFHIFKGDRDIKITNVNFVFEPADFTICANSGWKGVFTAEQIRNAELQLQNSGNVEFTSCNFDKVIVSPFSSRAKSVFTDCKFNNIYNTYAIKDIYSEEAEINGCTFENCSGGIYFEGDTEKKNITIKNNIFRNMDEYAPEDKKMTRGLVQFSASGNYTGCNFNITDNSSEGKAGVIRQLNKTVILKLKDIIELNNFEGSLFTENTFGENTVYYNGNSYKTLYDALKAVYMSTPISIAEIYCKPEADLGTMTHAHVADDIFIFGNGAKVTGGEHDIEVDTYKYNRTNGLQNESGTFLDKNINIHVENLDGIALWSQRNTAYTVNAEFINCKNMNRVYMSGTSGTNNIRLENCSFDGTAGSSNNTSVYSNAPGKIEILDTDFKKISVPVNMNNKSAGTQEIIIKGCTFTDCAIESLPAHNDTKTYSAAVRAVAKEGATTNLTIEDTEFNYSGTGISAVNGDVLIGDGRYDANDVQGIVTMGMKGTAATVVVQKKGYYDTNGSVADSSKAQKTEISEDEVAKPSEDNHFDVEDAGEPEPPVDPEEPPVIVYPVISSIAPIADQEYTGSAITPVLTVYDQDGEVITPNNYIVTYTDNVEPGTATVTVKGKAGVLGSTTATFTIVKKEDPQPPQPEKPGKVEITKSSSDFGRIRVYFDKVAAVGDNTMRYQIQSQKVGSDVVKTQYATVGYSYATVRDLAYNAKYNIKVRAYYVDENGERIYGDWSEVKTVYANRLGTANQVMYKAGITKLTAGKTSVAVNLKKVAFTKNPVKITYQIAYKKKGATKFSYAYTTNVKKTVYNLSKNTNYQFKVRYYYKSLVDNKLVFSPYTALKTVKTAR